MARRKRKGRESGTLDPLAGRGGQTSVGRLEASKAAHAMVEAIAMSSPSGRMSKRARKAANERLTRLLEREYGPALTTTTPQPTETVSLRRRAAELRSLAQRGMKPRAYAREASVLEARADELEGVA